ncbi:MAG TPA: DUF222 domain-containing protein [Pedococcus sp.]|nr:DUF222 domain-containing protein [Pedococcus sp.]
MAIAPDDWAGQGLEPASRPVLGAVSAAVEALSRSTPERIWALNEGEVSEVVRLLGVLSASVDAHLVTALAEAGRRGLGSGEGWDRLDWARAHAPLVRERALAEAQTVADAADDLRLAEVVAGATCAAAVDRTGEGLEDVVPVAKAAQLVRFHRSYRGMADARVLDGATHDLVDGARGTGGLPERILAVAVRHTSDLLRPDRLVEHDAAVRRAHRSLVKGPGPMGLSRYTLLLDEEGAAVVDAAVDALAKPSRDEETGDLDQRTPAARRADALVDLVLRAVEAPDGVPRQAKTSLVVTVGLDVLASRCRGSGLTTAGDLLTVGAVRRLACDAEVVPAVLGSRGEVLEQGRAKRLFKRGQIRHLWLRDGGCSFPGCSKPAAWTDAHHLVHWADGGRSDVANAALLCRAHHTVVHQGRYAGAVVDRGSGPQVEWDLTYGSYDDRLEALRRAGTVPRWPDPMDGSGPPLP